MNVRQIEDLVTETKRLKEECARMENVYIDKRVHLDDERLRNILEIGTATVADAVEGPIKLRLPTE